MAGQDDVDDDNLDDDDPEDDGGDGLVLDVEVPPAGLSYEETDDARAGALLAANGVDTTRPGLVAALKSGASVLAGAAARTLGARAEMSAVDDLLEVARASDDLLRAEAAFAAARMGVAEALFLLKKCLDAPVAISLGAPTAAGFLARLGDPAGWPVVLDALGQGNFLIRIVGAKQLIYFAPFHGPSVDVFGAYERALADDEDDVAAVARIELGQLDDPRADALLGG